MGACRGRRPPAGWRRLRLRGHRGVGRRCLYGWRRRSGRLGGRWCGCGGLGCGRGGRHRRSRCSVRRSRFDRRDLARRIRFRNVRRRSLCRCGGGGAVPVVGAVSDGAAAAGAGGGCGCALRRCARFGLSSRKAGETSICAVAMPGAAAVNRMAAAVAAQNFITCIARPSAFLRLLRGTQCRSMWPRQDTGGRRLCGIFGRVRKRDVSSSHCPFLGRGGGAI